MKKHKKKNARKIRACKKAHAGALVGNNNEDCPIQWQVPAWLKPWLVEARLVVGEVIAPHRKRECQQVSQALAQGRTPLLVGGPGVGKTAVALAAVHGQCRQPALLAMVSIRRRMSTLKKAREMAEEFHQLADRVAKYSEAEGRELYLFIDDADMVEPFTLESAFERFAPIARARSWFWCAWAGAHDVSLSTFIG